MDMCLAIEIGQTLKDFSELDLKDEYAKGERTF